jgi:hypothetical protein
MKMSYPLFFATYGFSERKFLNEEQRVGTQESSMTPDVR